MNAIYAEIVVRVQVNESVTKTLKINVLLV